MIFWMVQAIAIMHRHLCKEIRMDKSIEQCFDPDLYNLYHSEPPKPYIDPDKLDKLTEWFEHHIDWEQEVPEPTEPIWCNGHPIWPNQPESLVKFLEIFNQALEEGEYNSMLLWDDEDPVIGLIVAQHPYPAKLVKDLSVATPGMRRLRIDYLRAQGFTEEDAEHVVIEQGMIPWITHPIGIKLMETK